MPVQSTSGVVIAYKRETTFGTLATNDATARRVPYVSSSLALQKTAIENPEIRSDFQRSRVRHGNRQVAGELAVNGQVTTYRDLIESVVRRDFTQVTTLAALTNVTSAVVGTGGTFTRAAGSWITDGLRVGMVIRMTGWTTTAVANNSRNYTIAALTATVLTVVEPVAAKASGDSVVVSIPGRVTWTPATSHTQHSYSIEEWSPDVPRSDRFLGCRVGSMGLSVGSGDRAQMTFAFTGRDRQDATTQFYTSATAAGGQQMHLGASGLLVLQGGAVGYVTSLSMTIDNGVEAQYAIGTNMPFDVAYAQQTVSGELSCYFESGTLDDLFDDETPFSLILRLTDDNTANANAMQFAMTNLIASGGTKGAQGNTVVKTFQFTAARSAGTSGDEATTVLVQDTSLT